MRATRRTCRRFSRKAAAFHGDQYLSRMESSSETFRITGPSSTSRAHARELGDFTTDGRLLVLVPMAAAVGVIGAAVARALVFLIAVITNIAYYHRLSQTMVSPAANQLGVAAVVVPIVG